MVARGDSAQELSGSAVDDLKREGKVDKASGAVKDGLDKGDKAFHLVDPSRRDDHLRRLADAGIDVEGAMASGQLEVHPWQDGPLHGERFDQDTWLAGFE